MYAVAALAVLGLMVLALVRALVLGDRSRLRRG